MGENLGFCLINIVRIGLQVSAHSPVSQACRFRYASGGAKVLAPPPYSISIVGFLITVIMIQGKRNEK